MELPKAKPVTKCRKCKSDIRLSDKFCPACGGRLGFGVREEGEIRSLVRQLSEEDIVVDDLNMRANVASDVALIERVLSWVLGDIDTNPLEVLKHAVREHGQVKRRKQC